MRISLFLILSLNVTIAAGFISAGDDRLTLGKEVFMNRCKMCHGEDGQGNPSMANILKVEFKPMDGEYVQNKEAAEIEETITKGKGKMAPVRGLKPDQIEAVIAYVKSLDKEK